MKPFTGDTIVKVTMTKHDNRKGETYWLIKYKNANGRVWIEKQPATGGFPRI